MSDRSSHRHSPRRRFTRGWQQFSQQMERRIRRLPPGTGTALIFAAVLVMGLVGMRQWQQDDVKAAMAMAGLGVAGVAWYFWSSRRMIFRRRHSRRSRS